MGNSNLGTIGAVAVVSGGDASIQNIISMFSLFTNATFGHTLNFCCRCFRLI